MPIGDQLPLASDFNFTSSIFCVLKMSVKASTVLRRVESGEALQSLTSCSFVSEKVFIVAVVTPPDCIHLFSLSEKFLSLLIFS